MSGRIKILGTKLNAKVTHYRKNNYKCLCELCKSGKHKSKYQFKGKTYQQQILKSLEGINFSTTYDDDYVVFNW